jgi:hypothetical protein
MGILEDIYSFKTLLLNRQMELSTSEIALMYALMLCKADDSCSIQEYSENLEVLTGLSKRGFIYARKRLEDKKLIYYKRGYKSKPGEFFIKVQPLHNNEDKVQPLHDNEDRVQPLYDNEDNVQPLHKTLQVIQKQGY